MDSSMPKLLMFNRRWRTKLCILLGILCILTFVLLPPFTMEINSNEADSVKVTQNLKQARGQNYSNVFLFRQQHLAEVCQQSGRPLPSDLSKSVITGRMLVEPVHRILYCPVEKVASTFWKQTLGAMMSFGKYKTPFDVKIMKKTKLTNVQEFRTKNTNTVTQRLIDDAESLLVVRNPYVKTFSAYVDKLFHANYLFWKTYGEQIKLAIRKYKNPNSDLICGNDVTFSEFVKYLVYANEQSIGLNPHFTPIYKHCDPCSLRYTYISKVETLKWDFYHITTKWNNKFSLNVSVPDFEKDSALNIAKSHIRISMTTLEKFGKKCNMRPFQFLQRTWRFLQISGIISKNFALPFEDDGTARFVTKEDFMIAVENVLRKQPSWAIVKKQRQEALIEAYQGLAFEDKNKLREILLPDCRYFDYDDKPPELFNTDRTDVQNDFRYLDLI